MRPLTWIYILFLCIPQEPVHAQDGAPEPLLFRTAENTTDPDIETAERLVLRAGWTKFSKPEIARADLNGDGRTEIILRPGSQDCDGEKLCTHAVIGMLRGGVSDGEPVLLGLFDARKLFVSGKKSYGVRGLAVYNDPENDFHSVLYVWDPFRFRFAPEE